MASFNDGDPGAAPRCCSHVEGHEGVQQIPAADRDPSLLERLVVAVNWPPPRSFEVFVRPVALCGAEVKAVGVLMVPQPKDLPQARRIRAPYSRARARTRSRSSSLLLHHTFSQAQSCNPTRSALRVLLSCPQESEGRSSPLRSASLAGRTRIHLSEIQKCQHLDNGVVEMLWFHVTHDTHLHPRQRAATKQHIRAHFKTPITGFAEMMPLLPLLVHSSVFLKRMCF